MDLLLDAEILARIQFAATAAFHFLFVPLSVGIGLIMALMVTKAFRSKDPKDEAAARLWVKILAVCFTVGVVTGLAMEFAFGANWADYSRFVGSIFGAPLAAEALLSFFMESIFLGIIIFGWKKIGRKFYLIAAWLTWFGSTLSALWILIANSWMQTPAGAGLSSDGTRAEITDFLAAAFNPSLGARYFHTVLALLVVGAFVAMAISAYYMYKKKHPEFAISTMKLGAIVGVIATCALLVSAHASAVVVSKEQPTKFAMMEGMFNSEAAPLYVFGYVDQEAQQVVAPFSIPGGASMLATGSWDTEFQGLNQLAKTDRYGAMVVEDLNVNLVFQSYHLMVLMFILIAIILILALVFTFGKGKVREKKWLQLLLIISPIIPTIAIQSGWMTAEYGRQPWVVYPSSSGPEGIHMLTSDGISQVVSAPEIIFTLALFTVVYTFLFVMLLRVAFSIIKKGPQLEVAEGTLEDSIDDAIEAVAASSVSNSSSVKEGE